MSAPTPGPFDAFAQLAGALSAALSNRIELAGIELGEARARTVLQLAAGVVAALLLTCAVLLLSAWLAVALWPTLGAAVLGWIALAYGALAAALLGWARARLRASPPLLGQTIAELRADAAFIRTAASPPAAPGPRR